MTGTFGMLITAAAIALLVAREVLSAAWLGRDSTRLRIRSIDLVLIPLLIAFAAVVVIRFDRLSL